MNVTVAICLLSLLAASAAGAASPGLRPTREEMAEARRWAAANLGRAKQPSVVSAAALAPAPGLVVLANHDRVLINGRPAGRPLKIGEVEYRRGLLCHAVSQVVVRLPGPGRSFTASVGVDAHAGAAGSILFSVDAAGKEAFRSPVMRCGGPALPVAVDLEGSTEFTLRAGDAGDGIACDHADWAEARVTLADGREVWLDTLPLVEPAPPARLSRAPAFSFVYAGKHSDELLPAWRSSESTAKLDAQRARRTQTYTDPATGLVVRCEAVTYSDFPVVEWTLTFRNGGTADTPLLEDVQALDTRFERGTEGEFLLHHAVGSPCRDDDYRPLETPLGPGASKRIAGAGGRPTNSDLSYFNLEWGGRGVIAVVGWPGQWAGGFVRDADAGVRAYAGQERVRLRLRPGEEMRTPLVVLQFWRGDWIRAQNLWRRWMVAHNLPRPGGKPLRAGFGGCFGAALPAAAEEIAVLDAWKALGIHLDHWIIDAGWYPCSGNWVNVGTWEPDPARFPRGLREVSDRAHAHGARFSTWFEPERVAAGSWLAENHPEWVHGGKAGGLLDLGNPEAWRWVLERIGGMLASEGIDLYRQDFNIDPLSYWRGADAEGREGITENAHVRGYLAYWDELLRRQPGLMIDTCASGGRRNDLETLRRSVPLLRSDWAVIRFNREGAIGQQCQTYGISFWMPYHGTGAPLGDAYTLRSSYCPAYRIGCDPRDPAMNRELLRRTVAEYERIRGYLLGDFYPLTPYSLADTDWLAWQFDVPEQGEGVVQAFRRDRCPAESPRLKLRGLDPRARYILTDLDAGGPREMPGRELMEEGLAISLPEAPAAAILTYARKRWGVRKHGSAGRLPPGGRGSCRAVAHVFRQASRGAVPK